MQLTAGPPKDIMELRVTERYLDGKWSVVRFSDLSEGDIVRIDDLPNQFWKVYSTPKMIVNESGIETMSFIADPLTLL